MDKYGYLVNPDRLPINYKKWAWVAGFVGMAALVYWLVVSRRESPVGKLARKIERINPGVQPYTVTAPATVLEYSGAGMPFGIEIYGPVPDYHREVDNNGIPRVVSDEDGIFGGLIKANGYYYFVSEAELNRCFELTRQINIDILLTIMPYNMLGPGYLGYCTSGAHIGQEVYVTLTGQIGMALSKVEDGQLDFVPLEVVDQAADIWSVYLKPGGK
jgi:hypothetical protein